MASPPRRVGLAFLVGALLLMLSAVPASATTVAFITDQWIDANGLFGPRHSITQIYMRTIDGSPACLNALNDGGTWAGSTVCSWGTFVHPYCGCVLRYPWGGDQPNAYMDPTNLVYASEDY